MIMAHEHQLDLLQSGKDVWLIGKGGELRGSQEEGFKLVMDNGRGDHCPNGKKRKTIVRSVHDFNDVFQRAQLRGTLSNPTCLAVESNAMHVLCMITTRARSEI